LHTVTGSLTAREGFISPVLEHVEGTLDIAGVTDESLSFPALTRVGGDLTLRDVWVDRIQWPVLHSVGGHLDIQDCGADTIESPHLQDVGGDLTLATSRFEALTGFDSLRTVGGSLSLHSLDGFETIEGFSQLASVESILIEACPNLMGIDAFGAIERLNGALSLSELHALHYVGGWSSLTAIDGAFTVRGTALASLDPWPPVVTTGSFSLEDQPLLSSLKEFDSLTHVFHNLLIRNTPQLEPEHIEQWLKAIEVNGSISIE